MIPKKKQQHAQKEELIDMIYYLIDNVYVTCGDSLFRQKIGIPMGTDSAPFLANLFLFSYENEERKSTIGTQIQPLLTIH